MTRAGHRVTLGVPRSEALDIFVPDDFDFLAHQVTLTGRYFPPHYELALDLAAPGGVILDLGAHLGTLSLAAAARGFRVIAVEASPRNVELLRQSVVTNQLQDSITIVPVAVSNRPGTARFRQEGAWGQITDSIWASNVVEVRASTVTEILAELDVHHVDVVKLDIEGSEIAALEGMAPLLSAKDAPAVVYESNAHTLRMFDVTPEQLVSTLADFGYDSYLLDGEERRLTPVTRASFQPETNVDYAALKGPLDLPPGWSILRPRTDNDLARAVSAESREPSVALRAQVARSLERAPESLLARRDVQLTLSALALDPDETVARAAAWWVRPDREGVGGTTSLAGVRRRFQALGEQGRALRDRLGQIRIRWGARP